MSRNAARRTLIAYDVPNDRRRTRLADALGSYGDRIQYSVFVVDISPARLLRLEDAIRGIIDGEEDSVLFCDLGRVADLEEHRRRFRFLGQSREPTPDGPLVF